MAFTCIVKDSARGGGEGGGFSCLVLVEDLVERRWPLTLRSFGVVGGR